MKNSASVFLLLNEHQGWCKNYNQLMLGIFMHRQAFQLWPWRAWKTSWQKDKTESKTFLQTRLGQNALSQSLLSSAIYLQLISFDPSLLLGQWCPVAGACKCLIEFEITFPVLMAVVSWEAGPGQTSATSGALSALATWKVICVTKTENRRGGHRHLL